MKKSILINIFYTLGIIVSVIGIKWALDGNNYPVMALFAITGIFFFYLKIKLIKGVRKSIKDRTI